MNVGFYGVGLRGDACDGLRGRKADLRWEVSDILRKSGFSAKKD